MPADDFIEVDGNKYVLASLQQARPVRVLKYGDSFAVFDHNGNIQSLGTGEQGVFLEGTRFISKFEMFINDVRPVLLNSTVKNDNTLLTVDLTTPDLYHNGEHILQQGTVHIFRGKLLWDGACYEHCRFINYGDDVVKLTISIEVAADYADIFEVRGMKREKKGRYLLPVFNNKSLTLGYEGLDGITRKTLIEFSEPPLSQVEGKALFELTLAPQGGAHEFFITASLFTNQTEKRIENYERTLRRSAETLQRSRSGDCVIHTSSEQFNNWLNRSQADVHMLITQTSNGPYPYAGIPWFSTPFGRDGIITALEYLWVNPELARGVLRYLAVNQAQEVNPEQEAEPGKILHEVRKGEMAALGEIPFGRYYGTVDATPLFVMLAGAYYECTTDIDFIHSIWPNIEAALRWCDTYGDPDQDGFVEYQRHNPRGLIHQGWKDSNDSVFHADGRPAEGNIALCEVQSYVYGAKSAAATLARRLGKTEFARELFQQAELLKDKFNRAFWCDELSTYAIALDGDKKPCRIRSSNAGHVLYSGIALPHYAQRAAETLLMPESFSGWGVRTVASSELRYNPMSYHNGSIWPHDNAIIAMGLARYGFQDKALKILSGLFDASLFVDLHRLPELFCGFIRRPDEGPTRYPAACIPQAWASASVFYLLQACLGMQFSSEPPQLRFYHPRLPDCLHRLEIHNLRVGRASLDLVMQRYRQEVSVNVVRKSEDINIAIMV